MAFRGVAAMETIVSGSPDTNFPRNEFDLGNAAVELPV